MKNVFVRPGHAALGLLFLASCSSSEEGKSGSDNPGPPEKYLGLEVPAEGKGLQVRSQGTTILPGEDVEYCEIGELPGDPGETYFVNRIELGNNPYSHHMILNVALPGSSAEARLAERSVGERVDCPEVVSESGQGFEFTAVTQGLYADTAFPAGVGRRYHGGQRFVFNYHYYNTTDHDIEARSAANFHFTEEANVEHVAQMVSFRNFTIDTPVGDAATFVGECSYDQDVYVQGVVRHTHRWGMDYSVWLAGGARDGEHLWTSHDFAEELTLTFDEPMLLRAGEGFRFECNYENTTDHPLRYGPNATDEMCILFSTVWEANDGEVLTPQDCNITQLGSDGIGRTLDLSTFPKPTEAQFERCMSAEGQTQACLECACTTCGTLLAECRDDVDCDPILACVRSTGCKAATCAIECGEVINAHSPGAAKIVQIGSCLAAACPIACPQADPNAG